MERMVEDAAGALMADPLSWSDPSTWVGASGVAALAASAIKAAFDWRSSRARDRATSEDLVRDDLLIVNREQRTELVGMRGELAAARAEMRAQHDQDWVTIRACEERAERFLDELRKLHSENDAVRGRYHRLVNYIAIVRGEVDIDRIERGLPPLTIPSWVDETLLGPAARPPEQPS